MSSSNAGSKTVFLLDHTHWMREGSGIEIEIDSDLDKGGASGSDKKKSSHGGNVNYLFPSLNPQKSIWSCAVENVLEYARIVWDLFGEERLLRFALCQGQQGQLKWLNNWELTANGKQQQSLNFVGEAFANVGPPMQPSKTSSSSVAAIQLGLKSAIEALSEPTSSQIAFMNGPGGGNKSSLKAINKGRVICITSCTADSVGKSSAEELEDFFSNALTQHNRMVAPASDHLLPILECELVIISVHPLGKQHLCRILGRPLHEVSPILRSEIHVAAADCVYKKIVDLCALHHDLISTTVTGIPMKEEQNGQRSANYDVPLWHPRMPTSCEESSILKWSSPAAPKTGGIGAGAGGLVHHCISASRVTPVDVNSRPSTCLTTFVMNGRSVCLEMLKKGKSTSHMLTSHGGEIWMHIVETARNVLEDPPSISEGIGGRVTDYRIPDFAEFMKLNVLIPYPRNFHDHVYRAKPERDGNPFIRRRSSSLEDLKKPIEMAKARLIRKTTYWPMTINGSLLFSMAVHIEPLLRLLPLDSFSDMDKVECDTCIWNLMSIEARGEAPLPSAHHKKGQKRDEQWRAVYSEMESFIRANQHSENHKKVLECFLESRRAEDKSSSKNDEKTARLKDPTIDNALLEIANLTGKNNTCTDSPMSPPPPPAPKPVSEGNSNKTSLLALWTMKTEKKDLRTLTVTKLYSHIGTPGGNTESTRKVETK